MTAAVAVAGVGAGAGTIRVAEPRVAVTRAQEPIVAPPPPPQPMAPAATFVATPPPAPAPPRPAPESVPATATTPATAPGAVPGARRPSFRNQDPQARAQRIARALVSDIVAYNKDKLKTTLEAGTLRNEFREEIRKSWEEYVEQVGLELAKNTPYFRDSLNEILAKGQKVF
ncbi:MAG: hypothetical protein ACT4O1_00725 [Gemmatimonadota bacterium]